jgi:antitoxin (DNA-binding transcriptional repressor) of toxin-antitoxin stability system
MRTVSLLEFRKNSKKILELARRGERMIMTYRSKPVFRIEPIGPKVLDENDTFYTIDRLAQPKGGHLDNKQMDKIVYGL